MQLHPNIKKEPNSVQNFMSKINFFTLQAINDKNVRH